MGGLSESVVIYVYNKVLHTTLDKFYRHNVPKKQTQE